MQTLGEIQVLVRAASDRIPGEQAAARETTQFRIKAAVMEMNPHLLITAAFLAFTKANLAYETEDKPAHIELPTVEGGRVKYAWLNAYQSFPFHSRVKSGEAPVHALSFPAPSEESNDGEARRAVYHRASLRAVYASHSGGQSQTLNQHTQDREPATEQPSTFAPTPTQGGIPAHRPKVFPLACGLVFPPEWV